jgi:hypothetical protein
MAEVGRLLHPDDRESLLAAIPPAYPRVVARHVALESGAPPAFALPGEAEGFVVGVADDGAGVQALVVEIGGTTERPDGSTCHITQSLAAGRDAVESNHVIGERGWTPTPQRHRVRLEPKVFSSWRPRAATRTGLRRPLAQVVGQPLECLRDGQERLLAAAGSVGVRPPRRRPVRRPEVVPGPRHAVEPEGKKVGVGRRRPSGARDGQVGPAETEGHPYQRQKAGVQQRQDHPGVGHRGHPSACHVAADNTAK